MPGRVATYGTCAPPRYPQPGNSVSYFVARAGTLTVMRPVLKPGLLHLWRDSETIQIGVDPRRGFAVTGLGRAAAAVLSVLDGSRDRAALLAEAAKHGIPADATDRVLTLLAAGGALDDFPAAARHVLPLATQARLAPELATASLAQRDGDGGVRAMVRRRSSQVRVHGADRIGSSVACLLAASGIGHLTCRDQQTAGPADVAPAGLEVTDSGAPRERGVARAVRRAAPDVRTDDDDTRPDLVVLTEAHDSGLIADLMAERIPHLMATAAEAIGVVGPLVLPGRSACLRCLDLTRRDRDPAWPLITAQLAGKSPATPACDAVLATAVAAHATAQVLAYIDRSPPGPIVTNGTLELVLPDWRWRRRTWPPHDECACGSNSLA
jgi:ThiF family